MNKKRKNKKMINIIISSLTILFLLVFLYFSIIIYKNVINKKAKENNPIFTKIYVSVYYDNNKHDKLIYDVTSKWFGKIIENNYPENYTYNPFQFKSYTLGGNLIIGYKGVSADFTFYSRNSISENWIFEHHGIDFTYLSNYYEIKTYK